MSQHCIEHTKDAVDLPWLGFTVWQSRDHISAAKSEHNGSDGAATMDRSSFGKDTLWTT